MDVTRTTLSRLRWRLFVARRKAKVRLGVLRRHLVAPKLPENSDGRVLIHLGCGDIAAPGFINVDARPAPHVHHVRDVTDLSIFPGNHADLIYACHVLEHVPHRALPRTLWEWRRVLKPGGILRLSVPDFDKIIHIYESCSHEITSICGILMGNQDYAENAHHSVFNHTYMSEKLSEVGFTRMRLWDPITVENHDFSDCSGWSLNIRGSVFPVSLNIEASK